MSRLLAWGLHLSTIAVAVTGLVYAWMRYFMEPADPYAVVSHPAQPFVQHLHLWTAPLLVFGLGSIWQQHVWKHWRNGAPGGRSSGLTMMLTAAPMILSGYFIQTSVTPFWRTLWVVVHLVGSALWIGGYLAHALTKKNGKP